MSILIGLAILEARTANSYVAGKAQNVSLRPLIRHPAASSAGALL